MDQKKIPEDILRKLIDMIEKEHIQSYDQLKELMSHQ